MQYLLSNYARLPFAFARGEGSYLFDFEGKKYLDFASGIGVCSLGHNHPRLVAAIAKQAAQVMHYSNLYQNPEQERLAQRLAELMPSRGRVLFCNSGAEANEALLKAARAWGGQKNPARQQILVMAGGFHGRTFGAMSATAQAKIQSGFGDLLAHFEAVIFNDIADLRAKISPQTVAILLEPIQGEGGIFAAEKQFLAEIGALCQRENILLLLDEVQCGLGRVGEMLAYRQIYADLPLAGMSWAKGLGGGFPIGAIWLDDEKFNLGEVLGAGKHGTTFGGSPLACAAAHAVLDEIDAKNLCANVSEQGDFIKHKLGEFVASKHLNAVRGLGLMLGLQLGEKIAKLAQQNSQTPSIFATIKLAERGLLVAPAGEKVIRFLPALNINHQQAQSAVEIVQDFLTANFN